MHNLKVYFKVNTKKYVPETSFEVVRPASLIIPKNNAVMFINEKYIEQSEVFHRIKECLIFWPENIEVPAELLKKHAIYVCPDPRFQYCKFYQENAITYLPKIDKYVFVNGAYIAKSTKIGKNVMIFPGAYIGGEVVIGNDVYIGGGAKLVGEIYIGDRVIIRENVVVGADGLSTDRDENGHAVTMPQFGGVIIENDVQIGAGTIIGRGAIDYTVIRSGCKIDNSCFISHNVQLGADTFIVGETIMFGSSCTGAGAFISGNTTIRNKVHIGENAMVGMGAVVTKDVPSNTSVSGNPAKPR